MSRERPSGQRSLPGRERPPRPLLLVKYGELGLKGKNRPEFERVLQNNIAAALGRAGTGPGFRLRRLKGRFFVEFERRVGEAPGTGGGAGGGAGAVAASSARTAEAVARVFGVVGVAQAYKVPLDLEEVARGAILVAREEAEAGAVRTFKLEVRRPNKAFPVPSPEVASVVGRRILDEVPGLAVDVHEPDLRIGVEIRDDGVYLYGREIPGPGGLPAGTSGRAVALISGGIDSPVAIWMAMKRGLIAIPLHFWSFPFTGERARQKVVDLCAALGAWGPLPDLLVCPFTEIQTAIRDRCPEDLRVTLMRRMMLRIATRLARDERALALVTGESLGQVASQTLESLATIEAVTDLPVLRPLIGLDKEEIIERARAIGTFELSTLPYEDCCTLFVPAHPRTKPTREEAERAEAALDVERLVSRAVSGTERQPGRA